MKKVFDIFWAALLAFTSVAVCLNLAHADNMPKNPTKQSIHSIFVMRKGLYSGVIASQLWLHGQ